MLDERNYAIVDIETVSQAPRAEFFQSTIRLPDGSTHIWHIQAMPDLYIGVPIIMGEDGSASVIMNREWRGGGSGVPEVKDVSIANPIGGIMTQFTGSRGSGKHYPLLGLNNELKEEYGLTKGVFQLLLDYATGLKISGRTYVYTIFDFELGEPQYEAGEFLETIILPIKGLFEELTNKTRHNVTGETLGIAAALERFIQQQGENLSISS